MGFSFWNKNFFDETRRLVRHDDKFQAEELLNSPQEKKPSFHHLFLKRFQDTDNQFHSIMNKEVGMLRVWGT